MAKQKGIVRFTGTLEGINFYERKGVAIARKAGGGFNSEAIKNKPSMVRVRENSSEFGRCSTVKKEFRLALRSFLQDVNGGDLHGRMMRLFQQIKVLDIVNKRGERTVAQGMTTAMGRKLLQDFDFTPKCNIQQLIGGTGAFDWNTFSYSISNFDIKRVNFPKGATHASLQLGLLCFDFDSFEHTLYESAVFYMDSSFVSNSILLELTTPPSTNGVQIAVLGLRFYQEVENELYAFNSEDSVGFEVVGCRM